MVRGPQKQCSQVSDIQIQKYKYTNTQIQLKWKLEVELTSNFLEYPIPPPPLSSPSVCDKKADLFLRLYFSHTGI